MSAPFVHPTAEVEEGVELGSDCAVWNWAKVRTGARLGAGTSLGQGVFVDAGVRIGAGCRIQNGVSVYAGVTLGARVFVGPQATFTNDRVPRADDMAWEVVPTVVEDDASIGANATIVCGVVLGRACMVAAGTVVTRDVPPFGLVMGNPGRLVDYVDLRGNRLHRGPGGPPPELEADAGD